MIFFPLLGGEGAQGHLGWVKEQPMLKDDFYTLESLTESDGKWQATIHLNADHAIFEGHFPETPVVPGVTMMQMTREVSEVILKTKLDIHEAHHIKFMSVINPQDGVEVDMELDIRDLDNPNDGWRISNTMRVGERVCLKFRGILKTP